MTAKGSTGMEVLLSTLEVNCWQTLINITINTNQYRRKKMYIWGVKFYSRGEANEWKLVLYFKLSLGMVAEAF